MPYDPNIPEEEPKNRDAAPGVVQQAIAASIAPKVSEHGFLR